MLSGEEISHPSVYLVFLNGELDSFFIPIFFLSAVTSTINLSLVCFRISLLGNILGVVKNYKRLVETFRLMRRGELFELDNYMQAAVFQELVVVMIYSCTCPRHFHILYTLIRIKRYY